MRSRLAKNALILLSCGQLPIFSTTVLPVANFTRILIPGSSWPHTPPTTNTRMAYSAPPLHESTTKKPFLHIHPCTLKTNQGTALSYMSRYIASSPRPHSGFQCCTLPLFSVQHWKAGWGLGTRLPLQVYATSTWVAIYGCLSLNYLYKPFPFLNIRHYLHLLPTLLTNST